MSAMREGPTSTALHELARRIWMVYQPFLRKLVSRLNAITTRA